jgi:hypothetical protein
VLSSADENPMVRHEAAEALGAIASPECLEILSQCALPVLLLCARLTAVAAGLRRIRSA